jgi:glucose-1-phosphate adenylyltransferase
VMMGSDSYETPAQLQEDASLGRPRIGVGSHCKIRGAIIDKNARVGDGCTLFAEGKADGVYAGGAVIVRDGVLVVPRGAVLPSGTTV